MVLFQNKEKRNGAKKAPASAPQEMPISCAIKVTELWYWISAIIAEIAIKTTIKIRMETTCFFSFIFLIILSFSRSIVKVEEEAITSEDKVDMEADKTRITTSAIRNHWRWMMRL